MTQTLGWNPTDHAEADFEGRLDRWLAHHDWSDCTPRVVDDLVQHVRRLRPLHEALAAAGFARAGWPVEYGGVGGSATLRARMYDRLYACGLELPRGFEFLEIIFPTLIRFAPELARRHLADALTGRILLCQGFSEPDAGSDLASIRTRASRAGDRVVVNGHKTWIGNAQVADWCLLLVRTGTASSRHRGLTMLWVDMDNPGITRRAIPFADGRDEFAELYFDDVSVPIESVVGEWDQGWSVAMYLLQFERANWAWQRQCRIGLSLRLAAARAQHGLPAASAAGLGNAWLDWIALRAVSAEAVRQLADGRPLGAESSMTKLLLSRAERAVADFDLSVDWVRALGDGEAMREGAGEWFYARATAVFGGAAEIQRDIVAERLLGLPR